MWGKKRDVPFTKSTRQRCLYVYIDKVLIELISSLYFVCLPIFFGLLGYVENYKLLFIFFTMVLFKILKVSARNQLNNVKIL